MLLHARYVCRLPQRHRAAFERGLSRLCRDAQQSTVRSSLSHGRKCFLLDQEAEDIAENRFGSEELSQLADEMIAVMRQAPGVGLAAPQIGLGQKVLG